MWSAPDEEGWGGEGERCAAAVGGDRGRRRRRRRRALALKCNALNNSALPHFREWSCDCE
jgi:hypothetical protein